MAPNFNMPTTKEMKTYYCWRCESDMPFLDEKEWRQIEPLLGHAMQEIKDYRAAHGCDITTARQYIKPEATAKFEELTGMAGVHFEVMYHHRLADWGAACKKCGQLFRTPKASHCANCGQRLEDNV